MSFSRVAPVGFSAALSRFDWSRRLWPMAQTAADVPGARGGELKALHPAVAFALTPTAWFEARRAVESGVLAIGRVEKWRGSRRRKACLFPALSVPVPV